MRNFESLFIPGLLQTEDYARALIQGVLPLASNDEVEIRVAVRMRRQEALRKKGPLRLTAIIDQAVLERHVGGARVMHDQLAHLVEANAKANIRVQVIPFAAGAYPGMLGSLVVMSFPDEADPDLVYVDSMAGDLFLEGDGDVRRYSALFEHLQSMTLGSADSTKMIKDTLTRMS